jgi:hypothetical protein
MQKLENRPWWPELVQRKDAFSLRELAEIFDTSPGAIQSALKRKGLSRTSSPSGPRVEQSRVSVAKKMQKPRGRNARVLTEKRLAPFFDQLGQVADGEIAQRVGLSTATVARIRRSRGVASYTSVAGADSLHVQIPGMAIAWQILLMDNSRPFVVVAKSIKSAAKAAHFKGLRVREIRRVAPLFFPLV